LGFDKGSEVIPGELRDPSYDQTGFIAIGHFSSIFEIQIAVFSIHEKVT
jgi:hypothetical protein